MLERPHRPACYRAETGETVCADAQIRQPRHAVAVEVRAIAALEGKSARLPGIHFTKDGFKDFVAVFRAESKTQVRRKRVHRQRIDEVGIQVDFGLNVSTEFEVPLQLAVE